MEPRDVAPNWRVDKEVQGSRSAGEGKSHTASVYVRSVSYSLPPSILVGHALDSEVYQTCIFNFCKVYKIDHSSQPLPPILVFLRCLLDRAFWDRGSRDGAL
jgi:hypothetical protein